MININCITHYHLWESLELLLFSGTVLTLIDCSDPERGTSGRVVSAARGFPSKAQMDTGGSYLVPQSHQVCNRLGILSDQQQQSF